MAESYRREIPRGCVELTCCSQVFDTVVKTLRTAFNRMMDHEKEELQRSLDLVRHGIVQMSDGRLRWKMRETERQRRSQALLKWVTEIQNHSGEGQECGLRPERGLMNRERERTRTRV